AIPLLCRPRSSRVCRRIPMVTAEERCAHEVVLAERERAVWDGMRDLLEERAAGQAELASEASAASGAARASAADAAGRAWCAAGERIERLRRGEQVSRGEELDVERCPRDTRRGARYAGSYSLATRGYADANGNQRPKKRPKRRRTRVSTTKSTIDVTIGK